MPTRIPLFPLRTAVLLPRGLLPLNIFEPRYLAMIDHALAHDRMVGLIRPRVDGEMNPPLYEIGCAGRITSFTETDDGRYLITLTGLGRFRLQHDQLEVGGFRAGHVDWSGFTDDAVLHEDEGPGLRDHIMELLRRYLDQMGLSADWDSLDGASAETIVNSVTMSCPFEADEQQALLEAKTPYDRAQALMALMEMAILGARHDLGAPNDEGPLQ